MTTGSNRHSNARLSGLGRVALAGLIWGSIPLVIRFVDGASVVKVFFRVAAAGLALAGYLTVTKGWGELLSLPRQKWRQVVVQSLILTLNWVLFLKAMELTTVATAELLAYTGPVFVAALAPFFTKEAFDRRIVVPLAIALGGIIVIMVPAGLDITSPRGSLGAGLAFASALTYAVLLLRTKRLLHGISSAALMTVEYGVASLVLSPFVVAAYARGEGPSTAPAYAALVTLGVFHTAFSGFLFFGGLRRVRTDHAAVLTYVEPVSAVAFAALLLGEALTVATLSGGLMVVIGGILIARLDSREAEPVPFEAAGAEAEGHGE